MKIEIGVYYADFSGSKDVLQCTNIDENIISFKVIDPGNIWNGTTFVSLFHYIVEKYYTPLPKAYGTPLWKVLNE